MKRTVIIGMLSVVFLGGLTACGPTRESQENMARNLEQAQEPAGNPARQDLLPPPGNDPRLNP
jgi:hypothetical protein